MIIVLYFWEVPRVSNSDKFLHYTRFRYCLMRLRWVKNVSCIKAIQGFYVILNTCYASRQTCFYVSGMKKHYTGVLYFKAPGQHWQDRKTKMFRFTHKDNDGRKVSFKYFCLMCYRFWIISEIRSNNEFSSRETKTPAIRMNTKILNAFYCFPQVGFITYLLILVWKHL